MKILSQLAIFFFICLFSEWITLLLPFSLPSSIVALLLLLLLLLTKMLHIQQVENMGDFLLQNMAFFFIPAGVSIMNNFAVLKEKALVLFFICFITTILTFCATAYTVLFVMKVQSKLSGGRNHD